MTISDDWTMGSRNKFFTPRLKLGRDGDRVANKSSVAIAIESRNEARSLWRLSFEQSSIAIATELQTGLGRYSDQAPNRAQSL
ncbi:hypothetical protein F2Q70_00015036 [Brassica cretica]|uniref:Uncharacterized protein n=1 Tax=Brassica cretica TaxID=69181 RepID=A0A8S9L0L2_BRACR|nr:hypothetical protein F2Q70_00015036 [Brassica cretica]KAF2598986.1 hypothetical protein F2Q68_00008125 [Brassica cretica]